MFGLLRYFGLTSGAVVGAVMVVAGVVLYHYELSGVVRATETSAVALARVLANGLPPGIGKQESLRPDPIATAELVSAMGRLTSGAPILEIVLFDRRGIPLFASSAAGMDRGGLLAVGVGIALAGDPASVLVQGTDERDAETREVVVTHVPVRAADGTVVAALEVRTDVSAAMAGVRWVTLKTGAILAGLFVALYGVLLAIVSRADRVMRSQHEELLESERRVQAKSTALEGEISERTRMEEHLRRNLINQAIIAAILRIAQDPDSLEETLRRILSIVLTSHGLDLESKGGIFLADPVTRTLTMAAEKDLHAHLLNECAVVPYGHCLCGRAAATGKLVFADTVDHDHAVRFDGMSPHGHYCVPITADGDVLGVLNLYVREGHEQNAVDESFVTTVAGTLAEVIRRKQAEEALRQREEHLRNLVDNAAESIIVHDFDGAILSANRAACRELGYTSKEMTGLDLSDIHAQFDVADYLERWAGMKPGRPVMLEAEYRRRDGSIFPVEVHLGYYQTGRRPLIVAMAHDITKRREAQAQIEHMANHDGLTNLPTRALFLDRMEVAMANARRHDSLVALLFVDLDGFKMINDTLGHEAGDELLRQVARRLEGCVRETDTVARHGGDEFTILLVDLATPEASTRVAETILATLATPFQLGGEMASIGCSIGISVFPGHGETPQDLMRLSDGAMYAVKQRGRNGYMFAKPC